MIGCQTAASFCFSIENKSFFRYNKRRILTLEKVVKRMANPVWTDKQKTCIEANGGTLLVSAAAGAGKTAVL
ncbi:MAG: UvrD-helicase domain-containing protein, partial [Clostridia bacterium]|nr:UvrD-helicase domain-containing protein [Clostridia bacterium]